MFRTVPAFLGLGLITLWVVVLSTDQAAWLAWIFALTASLTTAVVGIVPKRDNGPLAALCLALVGLALLVAALAGFALHVESWLSWWALLSAGAVMATAAGVGLQGWIDRLRTPPEI